MKIKRYKCPKHNLTSELLESIVVSSNEYAIIATDLNNNIILWNKGAETIYGYRSNEMFDKNMLFKLHSDHLLEKSINSLNEKAPMLNISDHRTYALRKDSSKLSVSVTITPRINRNNKFVGHLIISKDITKLKLHEQFRDLLLKISHYVNSCDDIDEMCRAVITSISSLLEIPIIFICIFNSDKNIFYINSSEALCGNFCPHKCFNNYEDKNEIPNNIKGCRLTHLNLGINHQSIADHAIADFLKNSLTDPGNTSIIHIPLVTDVHSNETMSGILHLVVPTERKDFLLTESEILSLIGNEIALGIHRKHLMEKIKQSADNLEKIVEERTKELQTKNAQLLQSGKLATLGEMAAGIAHEINQPLGGISLISQGLILSKSRGVLTDELLLEKLNSINHQVQRIDKIITHLRTFARSSDNVKHEIDIKKPMLDVFKLIGQQLIKRDISIEFDMKDKLPIILADHNKLEQIFLNLIGNASDALEEFEAKMKNFKTVNDNDEWYDIWLKKILIKVYEQDNLLVIEIIDNGPGIPQDIRAKIFEPFFTTKEVGKGTGLGLSITYGIVKEFNGTIEVQSEENKGTSFIIKFPVYYPQ